MIKDDFYERRVFYSKEDGGWIAVAPALPGCSAFGKSPDAALDALNEAIKLWIETVNEKNWPPPKPDAQEAARKLGALGGSMPNLRPVRRRRPR